MVGLRHFVVLIGFCVLGAALDSGVALAAQTVNVSLHEDENGHMIMTMRGGSVKAGSVTFKVTNKSHDITHEFLIAPLTVPLKDVPYDKARSGIKESALKGVKELGDLEPGKSGEMTVRLKAGKYLLFCNLPGHYKAGMYHVLTVAP